VDEDKLKVDEDGSGEPFCNDMSQKSDEIHAPLG
jgi:hypothetical protein